LVTDPRLRPYRMGVRELASCAWHEACPPSTAGALQHEHNWAARRAVTSLSGLAAMQAVELQPLALQPRKSGPTRLVFQSSTKELGRQDRKNNLGPRSPTHSSTPLFAKMIKGERSGERQRWFHGIKCRHSCSLGGRGGGRGDEGARRQARSRASPVMHIL
jgi:hypothetical protein